MHNPLKMILVLSQIDFGSASWYILTLPSFFLDVGIFGIITTFILDILFAGFACICC